MTGVPLLPPRAEPYRRSKVALGADETDSRRVRPFSFRVGSERQTFYALSGAEAQKYAQAWAQARGLSVSLEERDEV